VSCTRSARNFFVSIGDAVEGALISPRLRGVVLARCWRDAPYFSDAERAALALTEAATRLSDRSDPVPDDVWEDAARHYDEQALAGLVLSISLINVWNRLNGVTRQVAGQEW
jgi:alkylhydroperoxidase family enzyme